MTDHETPRERPKRVQLRRTKGWRLPEGAVVVSRPGKWGNPFTVTTKLPPGTAISGGTYFAVPTVEDAVACFREMLSCDGERAEAMRQALPDLRGRDLACWFPLDQPCHADVLLEIANEEPPHA